MTTLFGIPNCDTMKKARAWLAQHGIEYQFHDYKKAGLDQAVLQSWVDQAGWNALLNRRGMTWRKVPQEVKDRIDQTSAIRLMLENPGMIKRPVLDYGGIIHIGFNPEQYEKLLQNL